MAKGAAFVTGGASGLGRAIAGRLASDGHPVVIADIDLEGADKARSEIEGRGPGYESSLRRERQDLGREAWSRSLSELDAVPILINNAGFDRPGFFLQSDPRDWKDLLDVNLTGVLNCIFVAGPHISQQAREQGYGRIVNIASDAGRVGSLGEAVYSAAKGGVIAFSKSMAREFARDKVTVNAVCPGPADTPMTQLLRQSPIGAKFMDGMVAATPMKRLVDADEVASAVAFFVSEEARFVTGQALSVSGGLTMAG